MDFTPKQGATCKALSKYQKQLALHVGSPSSRKDYSPRGGGEQKETGSAKGEGQGEGDQPDNGKVPLGDHATVDLRIVR